MKIQDIMSRPPITCRPTEPAAAAVQRMASHDCGALPVVDADAKIVGIVTDRDVCLAACVHDDPLGELRVEDALTRHVHRCREDDGLEAVHRAMREHHVRRMPVEDASSRVVGMVSLHDLARDAAHRDEPSLAQSVAKTLAATGARTRGGGGKTPRRGEMQRS